MPTLDEVIPSVLDGLVRGRYHLLLGAGASIGGEDRLGRPLLGAWDLAQSLIDEFDLPAKPEFGLSRIFEGAVRSAGSRSVARSLSDRFADVQPPEWQRWVLEHRWEFIWTLNIDDSISQTYASSANPGRLRVKDFRDDFDVGRPNTTSIVHLHGYVWPEDGNLCDRVIFDLLQYSSVVNRPPTWHKVFSDSLSTKPVLVVGASLNSELDLASALRRGNSSLEATGYPSLIIRPGISDFDAEEIASWGFYPVDSSADEFFRLISEQVDEHAKSYNVLPSQSREIPNEGFTFLQQFKFLDDQKKPGHNPDHFISGAEPNWNDVLSSSDASFDTTLALVQVGLDYWKGSGPSLTTASPPKVIVINGAAFSGKTTAMLRIGRELQKAGLDIYLHQGFEALNASAIAWWARNGAPAVLLIDSFASFSNEIEELVDDLASTSTPLLIVGAERGRRTRKIHSDVPPEYLHPINESRYRVLSNGDIERLISRLDEFGRLGRLSNQPSSERIDYFVRKKQRSLFRSLADLERGSGFIERMRQDHAALNTGWQQAVYAACSIVYLTGYPCPATLASDVAHVSVHEVLAGVLGDTALADVLEVKDGNLRPLHRAVARGELERLVPVEERFALSSAMVRVLRPYVSLAGVKSKPLEHRIATEMMRFRVARRFLPDSDLDEWYETFRRDYGWNARYWEQRALAMSEIRNHKRLDKAESFASKAVDIHADGFTLNTLGVVLFRRAVAFGEDMQASREREYAHRAVESLESSRDKGRNRFEHPYKTFFSYVPQMASLEDWLLQDWNQWYESARRSEVYRHPDLRNELDKAHERMLRRIVSS